MRKTRRKSYSWQPALLPPSLHLSTGKVNRSSRRFACLNDSPDYNPSELGSITELPMPIETALSKFPRNIKLKDGLVCKSRPLRKDDEKAFHEFFLSIPEKERMFIKHRVTEPEVI